jgi:hypothetical protein
VIGTPQARWRDSLDGGEGAGTQRVARLRRVVCAGNVLIHRYEPMRRIAEDHRLFRSPRMRVLVLESPARDQHAGIDQGIDDRLVGVALVALVGQYALAGEARRLLGEAAVGIHRVGNVRVDIPLL